MNAFNQRGKRPVKVYLCVFVCFLTKACHLELVSDLSDFLHATGLFCDNATNFVGESRELKEIADRLWNDKSRHNVLDHCSQLGVKFHFIQPRSPHFGGLWESAVKVAKQLLSGSVNRTTIKLRRAYYSHSSSRSSYELSTLLRFVVRSKRF